MGMVRFSQSPIYHVDRVIFAPFPLNQKKAPAAPQAPSERFFVNEHVVLDNRSFLLLAARCLLLGACCLLFAACCLLLAVCCLLVTAYCYWLLFAAYYLLIAAV